MEEAHQPVVGAVERTPYELGDVRRPDQPMPRNHAHDLHVVVGKPERRRLGSPAKPRSSCLRSDSSDIHPPIIPGAPSLAATGRGPPAPVALRRAWPGAKGGAHI